MYKNIGRSINVIFSLNDIPLGGQLGANFNRQAQSIAITNKINGDWAENLIGVKSWNIVCNGLYVISDKGFQQLENAFMNNIPIEAKIAIGENNYKGNCIITDFPLKAVFNKEFKYEVKCLGTGPLTVEDKI